MKKLLFAATIFSILPICAQHSLKLYVKKRCPYCVTVLKTLPKSFEVIDIEQNLTDRQALLEAGGKVQVPCLLIDGKPLYESEEILTWLKTHGYSH